MWRLDRPFTEPRFYPTEADALAAAGDPKAEWVVWFDSFDYDGHNPGESARRYVERAAAERAAGIGYVRALCDGLRQRLGLVAS